MAWRMLRVNVLEQSFTELCARPADQDGVQRTDEEHAFLAGPLGTTAMFLYDTAKFVQRANADYYIVAITVSSTDDPDIVDVGNTLSRVSDQIGKLEVLLETRWNECPPGVRDTPFTRDAHDSLRDICQQLTVIKAQTIDCYLFMYRYLS